MTPLPEGVEPVPVARLGRVHLVGIGGAGVSGIARILLARGVPVSGSDNQASEVLDELRGLGAEVYVGHDGDRLGDAQTVVVSSAIPESNPELATARRRGLRVLPRAAALASLMAGRRGVAVAGTHGKTTTTAMLTQALRHAGADPSFVIGGRLSDTGDYAHDGRGELFVAEADESDGSFLLLGPELAVVTNVEADHLDNYGTAEAVRDAFTRFVDRVAPDGSLVAGADDAGARVLADRARDHGRRVRTYGAAADADVRVAAYRTHGFGSDFALVADGAELGRIALRVPGRHNALNAAGACAAALALGYGYDEVARGLAAFSGTRRRFESRGEADGVLVVDSYAHHPTELAADLRTAREVAGGGRVIAAFQPHLYSRTRYFADGLGSALGLADEVVVLDVYGAREEPEPGVTGAIVAAAVPLAASHVVFEPRRADVPDRVADRAQPGDLVMLLGAGDVTLLAPRVLEVLRGRAAGPGRGDHRG